jgi:hypothetical protein
MLPKYCAYYKSVKYLAIFWASCRFGMQVTDAVPGLRRESVFGFKRLKNNGKAFRLLRNLGVGTAIAG